MKFTGIVTSGSRKAAELGFPTANIAITDPEPSGIYAARAYIGGKEYAAVAYADQGRKLLEAYIFDFSEDAYGKEISVSLEKKLRDAAPFTSAEEAKAQIAEDVAKAREYFKV